METQDDKENSFPAPKPLSGGSQNGMPTWADFLAQMENEGDANLPPVPAVTSTRSRGPVVPTKSAAELAEEAEKARKRKEEEELRHKKFREMKMRAAGKKPESSQPKLPLTDATQIPQQEVTAPQKPAVERAPEAPAQIVKKEPVQNIAPVAEPAPVEIVTPVAAPVPAESRIQKPSPIPKIEPIQHEVPSRVEPVATRNETPIVPPTRNTSPSVVATSPVITSSVSSPVVSELRAATLARFEDSLSLFEQQLRASFASNGTEDLKRQLAALQQENQVLQAKCARLEIRSSTLEETLKSKEHSEAELTKLCESLISKLESLT